MGNTTSDIVLHDAYQIVKKGSKQPEIFHLVALFEDNIAGDRLSDMVATIIEPNIQKYTFRIMKEFEITPDHYTNIEFTGEGFIQNPYRPCPVYFLPKEILHELPIAKGWDDISRVESDNQIIRAEMSEYVGEEWYKWASTDKKAYIREKVFMNPDACERVINGYREVDVNALDVQENAEYLAEVFLAKFKECFTFEKPAKRLSSFEAAMHIVGMFKEWVENNHGWENIQNAPKRRKEKAVQRFLYLAGKDYLELNDFDPSPETDSGRGPVDLKISRGNDKTLIEVKLSSNGQYLHGYIAQIAEYAKAERTDNLIYVYVDLGNPGRTKTIRKLYEKNRSEGKECPELVIIDSRKKNAASTYDGELTDLDFDMPEIDWDGLFEGIVKEGSEVCCNE